ncbi:hypothetical protein [Pseudomonas fluorescens]|uniref:Uncharacterized protein n=1 Tax=Pseudomonas fluorescens TaxID=294 RepID=A0A944HD90_PSEFL|nr:hypothetical protein [Pseudomonas fluorescens]MBT2296417.1 hypothetical protein [Pseudomonas fluorescens]MBT2308755.1 hypothetical protein [Pseudomonas fluorescens]MBT2312743.1 hypothetical protein [Pseudomonas fluorescens]MBT2317872.1 hypothetical protein [Pseudomonas fluorescens]MBT2330056.1 hypothetical protein [Pseudomonas fluorescens]
MTKIKLKRLKVKEQISTDVLKVFALVEKTTMTSVMMMLVFFFMNKVSLMNGFFGWEVLSGLIGYLAVATKKMYYDEALSELIINSEVDRDVLMRAMLSIGYSEKKVDVYLSKKLFSFFFYCKSEAIAYTPQRGATVFTGPYDKLLKLSRVYNEFT